MELLQYIDSIDKRLFELTLLYLNPEWLHRTSSYLVDLNNFKLVLYAFPVVYIVIKPGGNVVKMIVLLLLLLALSEGAAKFFKFYFARPRPSLQAGVKLVYAYYSFPSAHALNTMAAAIFMGNWFPLSRRYLVAVSLLIGCARYLANYHFITDIIGGWVMGYLIAMAYIYLISFIIDEDHYFKFSK